MLTRALTRAQDEAAARHLARCLALSAAGAAATALGARVMIPWWPVPVTMQVFFVLLCGAGLGRRWGAVAQGQYLLAGIAGLPVFAGGAAGPAVLLGPTGGYLVGFVVAAYATGWLTETWIRRPGMRYVAALAGAAAIWLCGWAWLAVWAAGTGEATPLRAAFTWGVAPFVGIDALKALVAAAIAGPLAGQIAQRVRKAEENA